MFENGLVVPFVALLLLCVYLIYSRNKFEDNVLEIYEEKLENWKNCDLEKSVPQQHTQKIVAIVWQHGDDFVAEFFDENAKEIAKNKNIAIKGKN